VKIYILVPIFILFIFSRIDLSGQIHMKSLLCVDPASLNPVVVFGQTDYDILTVYNIGEDDLEYSARIEYDIYQTETLWMTLDGGTTTTDSISVGGSDQITVYYDAADLDYGIYDATIIIESDFDTVYVPVTLFVEFHWHPEISNLTTHTEGNNIVLDWDEVQYSTGYNIYSSYDPIGTFILTGTVETNQFSEPFVQRKFYYVTVVY